MGKSYYGGVVGLVVGLERKVLLVVQTVLPMGFFHTTPVNGHSPSVVWSPWRGQKGTGTLAIWPRFQLVGPKGSLQSELPLGPAEE